MSTRESQLPARGQADVDPDDPTGRIGTVIDSRYHLTALVGQGGMGAVYRAEHVTIRRPVAVKLLHPQLAVVPDLVRRFEREAFAIGRIEHANCVTVSDFGKLEDGAIYLVMEYLEGKSLGDILEREGRLPIGRALHVIRHVVRGLRHAHHAGIVHRDIKPDNIVLVHYDGDPDFAKILDFGIAKLTGEAESEDGGDKLTEAGIAFGTPTYISPEQAVGSGAIPSSDLYSATIVLYEMLAGQPPFFASDKLELLAMHASRPPRPLAQHLPQIAVPAEVEALVQRGLAKRPEERFADADEYLAAIDATSMAIGAGIAPPTPLPRSRSEMGFSQPSELTPAPALLTGPVAHGGDVSGAGRGRLTRRQLMYVVGALLALALIIAVASGGDERGASWLSTLSGADSVVSRRAEEKLSHGAPEETIELLEGGDESIAEDSRAQLQLGHAYAHKSEYRKALDAYSRALAIDGSLILDTTLRTNLKLMIDDEGPVFVDAAALLIAHTSDPRAEERLLALTSHENPETRHRALDLATTVGLGEHVDRLPSLLLDLKQGKSCADRRKAVANLRSLGDKRAIPALKKARVRRAGRGRWRRRRNQNACLVQQATDAIKYLRSLPDAPAARPDAG